MVLPAVGYLRALHAMELATLIAGIAMLLVAAYCIVFNWVSVVVNARRRARQENSHVSMIFLVPQLFLATAYLLLHNVEPFQHAGWGFLVAGVLDASLLAIAWQVLCHGAKVVRALLR